MTYVVGGLLLLALLHSLPSTSADMCPPEALVGEDCIVYGLPGYCDFLGEPDDWQLKCFLWPNRPCLVLPKDHFGHFSLDNPMFIMNGNTATLRCAPGYTVPETVIRCNSAQAVPTWESPSEYCKPVVCGTPPSITNAEFAIYGSGKGEFMDPILYRCIQGFSSSGGPPVIQCTSDGTYSATTFSCT